MDPEKQAAQLALRSNRSPFWHYPSAFIAGMVFLMFVLSASLLLIGRPIDFTTTAAWSFILTLLSVAILETSYWVSILQTRARVLESLAAAKGWAGEGLAISKQEVGFHLVKGVQNQNILHLKQTGPEMLDLYHRLEAESAQPVEVPDLRLEKLAMRPWLFLAAPLAILVHQ